MGSKLPDLSSYPSLLNDPEYFSKCFNIFENNSNEEQITQKWIQEEFESTVMKKLPAPSALKYNGLRILGIGSGNEICELEMLLKLLEKFPKIEITVVEPSAERITAYKVLLKQREAEIKGITWAWKQESIEDFMKGVHDHFDLITIVHVLYFVKVSQLEERLSNVHQLLAEDGVMVLLHNEAEPQQSIENGFFQTPSPFKPMTTEKYIVDALQNLGISYQKIHSFPVTANITECITTSPLSEEGCCLLDLITSVKCVRSLKPDELKATIDFFRQAGRRSGEEWIYDMPVSVILVDKCSH